MTHHTKVKLKLWYLVTALACSFAGVLTIFYLTLLDGTIIRPVISFPNGLTLQTEKQIYKAGDTVFVRLNFCKYRPVISETQWSLVDTYVRSYEPRMAGVAEKGCKNILIPTEKIPFDAHADTYHFVGTFTYRANAMRDIVLEVRTNEFEVTQ